MDSFDPVVDARPGATGRWDGRAPLLLVVAVGILFLLTASPWLGARFGESHDGRNAAVWAMSSQAIRNDGIVDSRFGGKAKYQTYANHPPGIVAETAAAEAIGGEHRIVTRSPAWIGSLIALALLTMLLLDAGLSRWAAAAGVTIAGSSAMFLVYGSMLDTPVTAIPFTLAALVAVQRAVQRRPLPTWAYAVLGVLVAFAGWEATAMVAAAGLWLAIAALRKRAAWPPLIGLAAGNVSGLAVTLAWIHWVYGSFSDFTNEAGYRTADVTLSSSVSQQLAHLQDLVPIAGLVGIIGLAVALASSSRRPLALVTLLPVVAYALVFKGGAFIHDYWNFAVLIPLAVGAAVAAEGLGQVLTERFAARGPAFVVALAALGALVSVAAPSNAQRSLEASLGGPRLLDVAAAMAPAQGPPVAYLSAGGAKSPWIVYEAGRPGLALDGAADLEALARRSPDFPVLVLIDASSPRSAAYLVGHAAAKDGQWAVVEAADVVQARSLRIDS